MVDGQRHDVVLGHPVLAQLPHQRPGVVARHLEDGQASHVGEQGVAHGAGEVVQLGQALGGEHEGRAELAELGQHALVVHAGHRLHLVDHHKGASPLPERHASLLPYHGVHQVEQGSSHQGGHVPAHRSLGRGDEQDPALVDGATHVDGGAALAQDGPRPLRRCVVGQAGLHGGQGLGAVLAVPAAEVPGPPLKQVGVGDLLQHGVAEGVVGQQPQPVEDGVLLLRLHLLVGLVEGLDGLFEDGLHPRPPLLPEALGNAHHRVGGAVPVGEDAGVQQVDAGGAGLVGQVYELHAVYQRLGDVFEDAGHQVCVGVYDDDGVRVPARRLLPHLVRDEVVHQGGLAHAGACDVEVVAPEQVLGEADLPLGSRGGVADQRPSLDALGRGAERPRAGPLHQGSLVSGAGRVPQAGDLADAQDAAPGEQAGACGVQHLRVWGNGPDPADLEPRPGGVVVVSVCGGHRTEKLPGAMLPRVGGQDGDDLYLRVEGDAGDLLLYEDRVLDAASGLLPPPPGPAAHGQPESRSDSQEGGLPYLAVLHPQVALQGGQSADAEDGHRHAVHLEGLGLEGVGGLARLHAGPLVGLVQVSLRPVGAKGAQHQARRDEYPPSWDGLLHLEVDLVPPGLVVVGQGRLGS